MLNLMRHRVRWQRPVFPTSGQQNIPSSLTDMGILPCSIQPVSADKASFYQTQRGGTVSHEVYYPSNGNELKYLDRLWFGDRMFVVNGTRDLIELNRVSVAYCEEWPDAAKEIQP